MNESLTAREIIFGRTETEKFFVCTGKTHEIVYL